MSDELIMVRLEAELLSCKNALHGTRAENAALAEKLEAAEERVADLESNVWDRVLKVGVQMLDEFYPANIFTGESGDCGPVYIVGIRDALKRQSLAEAECERLREHVQNERDTGNSYRLYRDELEKRNAALVEACKSTANVLSVIIGSSVLTPLTTENLRLLRDQAKAALTQADQKEG